MRGKVLWVVVVVVLRGSFVIIMYMCELLVWLFGCLLYVSYWY